VRYGDHAREVEKLREEIAALTESNEMIATAPDANTPTK